MGNTKKIANDNDPIDVVMYAEVSRRVMLNFTHKHDEYYNYVKSLKKTHPLVKNEDSWKCDTYNSLHTTDLNKVELFQPLIKECAKQVLEFSQLYGVHAKAKAKCVGAWINLAQKGDYQESHIHHSSHFSVSYYVKLPENSGKIIFENHFHKNNMFPFNANVENIGPVNWSYYQMQPFEGELVMFRSNLYHMVEANHSDEDRVSISMNFVLS